MGGMEDGGQAFKVNNGKRERMKGCPRKKKGRGIYTPPIKMAVTAFRVGLSGLQGKNPPMNREILAQKFERGGEGLSSPSLGRIIRPRQNINTKMVITFASGLHF
jgi:hypothetical protein